MKRIKTYVIRFLPKYCFFGAVANVFFIHSSNMSWVYRKATDLYIDLFILRPCYTCMLFLGVLES